MSHQSAQGKAVEYVDRGEAVMCSEFLNLNRGKAMNMKRILGYVSDERGIESLEWIAIAALIVAMAIIVYPGTLQTALQAVIADISAKLVAL
jgi:Flp pilus assembly pilin Flp